MKFKCIENKNEQYFNQELGLSSKNDTCCSIISDLLHGALFNGDSVAEYLINCSAFHNISHEALLKTNHFPS